MGELRRCQFLCTFGTEVFCWGEDFQAGLKECHEGYFETGPRDKRENVLWKSKFATKFHTASSYEISEKWLFSVPVI